MSSKNLNSNADQINSNLMFSLPFFSSHIHLSQLGSCATLNLLLSLPFSSDSSNTIIPRYRMIHIHSRRTYRNIHIPTSPQSPSSSRSTDTQSPDNSLPDIVPNQDIFDRVTSRFKNNFSSLTLTNPSPYCTSDDNSPPYWTLFHKL